MNWKGGKEVYERFLVVTHWMLDSIQQWGKFFVFLEIHAFILILHSCV